MLRSSNEVLELLEVYKQQKRNRVSSKNTKLIQNLICEKYLQIKTSFNEDKFNIIKEYLYQQFPKEIKGLKEYNLFNIKKL
jgi:hypothetical protein